MKRLGYLLLMLLAGVYLLNPGLGVFELIPDNLPFVGNLDEATAVAVFVYAWRRFRGGSSPNTSSELAKPQ